MGVYETRLLVGIVGAVVVGILTLINAWGVLRRERKRRVKAREHVAEMAGRLNHTQARLGDLKAELAILEGQLGRERP